MIVESRDAEFFEDKFSADIVEHSNPVIEDQFMPQKETSESYKGIMMPQKTHKGVKGSIKKRVWETSSSPHKP